MWIVPYCHAQMISPVVALRAMTRRSFSSLPLSWVAFHPMSAEVLPLKKTIPAASSRITPVVVPKSVNLEIAFEFEFKRGGR